MYRFIPSLVFGFVLAIFSFCPAQDPVPHEEDLKHRYAATAAQITIVGGSTGAEEFDFISKPVLSWSNPERRTATGALYLWTHNSRPQVALCLYPTLGDKFDCEFQSLSALPVVAKMSDQTIWEPLTPGINVKQFPQTLPVAGTVTARLPQMRSMAREFSATLMPPKRASIPLRLLTTPLYRYPEPGPKDKWLDGSVFALVQGTDPEILVIIEATEGDDQQLVWNYAIAPMTMVPVDVLYRNELVWQTTKWAIQNRGTTYFVYKGQ